MDQLLAAIDADDARRPQGNTTLIFLGDLIDRGPDSSGVIERLRHLSAERPSARFLLGNHEEVYLSSLDGDVAALRFFHRIGGDTTIMSYGISEAEYAAADYPELLARFQDRVPAEHISFVRSFEDMIIIGDYAFVHAGIRPDVALSDQRAKDLRWIRSEFLDHAKPFEKMIIHGHSITGNVDACANRIGLDTGAYASNKLSAMGFEGMDRWILDTSQRP